MDKYNDVEFKVNSDIFLLSEFDNHILSSVNYDLKDNEVKELVYVIPNTYFTSFLILFQSLIYLIESSKQAINNFTEEIITMFPKNSLVKVDGKYLAKVETMELHQNGNVKNIVLKDKFNVRHKMPINMICRLQKYGGTAKRLNCIPWSNGEDGKDNPVVKVLLKLFSICLFNVNQSIIYVGPKKTKELLENILIEDVPLPSLFPINYYTDSNTAQNLSNDIFKRKPILMLTPYLENVVNLIKHRNSIIIIDGFNYIEGQTTLLDRLILREDVSKIIILQNYTDFIKSNQKYNGIKSKVFGLTDKKIIINSNLNDAENEYSFHHKIIYHLQNLDHSFMIAPKDLFLKYINFENSIIELLNKINEALIASDELTHFNNIIYALISHLRTAPAFIEDEFIDDYFNHSYSRLNEISNNLKTYCNSDQKRYIDEILKRIIVLIYSKEFKELAFFKRKEILKVCKENIFHSKSIVIIVRRKKEKDIFVKVCESDDHQKIKILTIKEFIRANYVFDTILLTIYPSINILDVWTSGKAKKIYYMLYIDEIDKLKKIKKQYKSILQNFIPLHNLKFPVTSFITNQMLLDHDDLMELDEEKKEHEADNILAREFDGLNDEANVQLHKAIYVEFYEGYYAFLTEKYKANLLLNSEEKKVVLVPVKKLEIGDQIIFINDPDDNLLEKYIEIKAKIDLEWKAKYDKITKKSEYWKKQLKKYKKNTKISLRSLKRELKNNGCNRTIPTINRWLTDKKMYAPRKDAILAIGKLTKNDILINKADVILKYANKRKTIHHKIRNKIEKYAIEQMFNKNMTDDKILLQMKQTISEKIYEVEISFISKEKREVPSYLINRLLDR